jgi:hypothetical protein
MGCFGALSHISRFPTYFPTIKISPLFYKVKVFVIFLQFFLKQCYPLPSARSPKVIWVNISWELRQAQCKQVPSVVLFRPAVGVKRVVAPQPLIDKIAEIKEINYAVGRLKIRTVTIIRLSAIG